MHAFVRALQVQRGTLASAFSLFRPDQREGLYVSLWCERPLSTLSLCFLSRALWYGKSIAIIPPMHHHKKKLYIYTISTYTRASLPLIDNYNILIPCTHWRTTRVRIKRVIYILLILYISSIRQLYMYTQNWIIRFFFLFINSIKIICKTVYMEYCILCARIFE